MHQQAGTRRDRLWHVYRALTYEPPCFDVNGLSKSKANHQCRIFALARADTTAHSVGHSQPIKTSYGLMSAKVPGVNFKGISLVKGSSLYVNASTLFKVLEFADCV